MFGDQLEVRASEYSQRVPLTRLTLRQIGFGEPGVEFAWVDGADHYAAHVLDATAARELLSSAPLTQLPQTQALRARQRKHRGGRMLGWSLLGLFVALPLLLILLFFMQADRIAAWVADQIPVAEEARLGREAFDSMKSQLKLIDSGAAYDAVQSLGKRISTGSKYTYEFHVAEDDTLNAFALPGGIVVVHTGLIKATKTPEELAGVLAHEVQHVEQRHSVENMVKQLGLRAVWLLFTGDIGGSMAGQAALELTTLSFSRDAEREADDRGFDLLVQQGIDPDGMAAFFKTMSEQAADAPAAFLSTHPLSADREAHLQERARTLDNKTFAPLGIQPWPPR